MKFKENTFTLSATDLSNHLGCEHLTFLNRQVATGKLKSSSYYDPALELMIQRGKDHEAAYVAFLEQEGLSVVDVHGAGVEGVIEAMAKGVDVIVQAALRDGQWGGYADILRKVEGRSRFGNWSYEVYDTKLSQNTRAGAILQLCLYTDLLSRLQDAVPAKLYIVKPGPRFVPEPYRFADFQAYYEMVKQRFENVMAASSMNTYPAPVEQCSICQWWQVCDRRRHDDDHLSLVAGIRRGHIDELEKQKIFTLEQFARTATLKKPSRGNAETFVKKHAQAKIQFQGRVERQLVHELLPVEPDRGFNRLPEPDSGDIYFDIEGDVFFPDGGLEYLLGYAYQEKGSIAYTADWSRDRQSEKQAFVKFMAFVMDRWKRFPGMHIYHFAPYEPVAVKRLARIHAVYENEVDQLVRAERFIDLHAVFKEALLASVERYSLKELEKFTAYTRKVDLHDASSSRKTLEIALEIDEFGSLSENTIRNVREYNEDDCLATQALHLWLEDLRKKFSKNHSFTRPELKTGEATENVRKFDVRAKALYDSLTARLPEDRTTWTDEQKAKWLLAHQIEYFRREDKSAWWEYFRVHKLEHEELLDERKAITGLTFVREMPRQDRERNVTHRYTFPEQEISISSGDRLVEVNGDDIGSVREISTEEKTIDIKKNGKSAGIHPAAVHVPERIDPGPLATSLMAFADAVDEDGVNNNWAFSAGCDLLMKRSPRLSDGSHGVELKPGEDTADAAIRIALALKQSVFAIQGPPGTGKTYTGANMIVALVKAGKKVGITAVSHKVIRNLAEACLPVAKKQKVNLSFVHKTRSETENLPKGIFETDDSDVLRSHLRKGSVGCGTAWLWAEDNSQGVLDYLFVDEAGQMSLSQVLSASRAAKNLVLLGDPQQLEQPQRGAHPEGSDVAALTYLLDGKATMPEGKGLFLGITRRLNPKITAFTSKLYYDGRLTSMPGLEQQQLSGGTAFDGAGLFYVPVQHTGNQNRAPEEVQVIVSIVTGLLASGQYTDEHQKSRKLNEDDILVVAPYNAQVDALREALPKLRVGTVDKFQGQEAPVVIYSMTASTVEDAPKGMSFLFNPNRLNVATSRARSTCILVAAPRLLEPECRTVEQMRWANGLCTFVGMISH